MGQTIFDKIPFLQWHLRGGTWEMNFLLKGPPVSCHVSGKEGKGVDLFESKR